MQTMPFANPSDLQAYVVANSINPAKIIEIIWAGGQWWMFWYV